MTDTTKPKLPKLPDPAIEPPKHVWPYREHYTADQMIAAMAQAAREERHRCAELASAHGKEPLHPDVPFAEQNEDATLFGNWMAQNIAAAILAQQEPGATE